LNGYNVSGSQLTSTLGAESLYTDVDLAPGDILTLTGPARYRFTHSIPEQLYDVLEDGSKRLRRHRISITLRKMCALSDL